MFGIDFLKRTYADGGRQLWPPDVYQRLIWASILELMKDGEHVMHIDTDAFPFLDPWHLFAFPEHRDADLVASCDCFGPGCAEFGCSLNPGVMFFRNSDPMRSVIRAILAIWEAGRAPRDEHAKSDMFMLNQYMVDHGRCSWATSPKRPVRYGDCPGTKDLRISLFSNINRGSSCGPRAFSPLHAPACRKRGVVIVHARNGFEVDVCKVAPLWDPP
eukprot:SRR837773.4250.p2 GENE.SRR837773.4250~~SRR837773.4250.p2  ORF type:complete len:236 (-),score=42.34 SRR837773.4250:14-661(-)